MSLGDELGEERFKLDRDVTAHLDDLAKAAVERAALGPGARLTRMTLIAPHSFIKPEPPRWTVEIEGPGGQRYSARIATARCSRRPRLRPGPRAFSLARRKGMRMGGVPPLGYAVRERKLIVVGSEAQTVRHIFRRYAALGSVRLLKAELEAQGIAGKSWTSASGRSWGGKPIGRGALYLMLQNRLYRGETVHKNETYPGEHRAIIEPALWDAGLTTTMLIGRADLPMTWREQRRALGFA
jgi:Recombinase